MSPGRRPGLCGSRCDTHLEPGPCGPPSRGGGPRLAVPRRGGGPVRADARPRGSPRAVPAAGPRLAVPRAAAPSLGRWDPVAPSRCRSPTISRRHAPGSRSPAAALIDLDVMLPMLKSGPTFPLGGGSATLSGVAPSRAAPSDCPAHAGMPLQGWPSRPSALSELLRPLRGPEPCSESAGFPVSLAWLVMGSIAPVPGLPKADGPARGGRACPRRTGLPPVPGLPEADGPARGGRACPRRTGLPEADGPAPVRTGGMGVRPRAVAGTAAARGPSASVV
jgi:hypothetical protein